jgi:hypothetical protein
MHIITDARNMEEIVALRIRFGLARRCAANKADIDCIMNRHCLVHGDHGLDSGD